MLFRSEVFALAGNDEIHVNSLNESISGGEGDDIYVFDVGFGRDIIIDESGIDTIKFATGIGINDITVKEDGNDFLIALHEDGKDFNTYNDVIRVSQNSVENIVFEDGGSISIQDIVLQRSVEESIEEKDNLGTLYEGSLNEDTSSVEHDFKLNTTPITLASNDININTLTDVSVTIVDATTGTYKFD